MDKIAEYAKFVSALITAVVVAGTTLIPADWAGYLTTAAAVLGAIATYLVPNRQPALTPDTDELSGDGGE